MDIHADFTFDCAGQGLFYHGKIYCDNMSFTVVYDCGTSNGIKGAKQNLSDLVDRYHRSESKSNQHIGLLAISHFDFDHVSHIPELLRNCKVDTVILPHIADELRLVFLAKAIFDAHGEDSSEFTEQQGLNGVIVELFRNPVRYFTEMGATQIVGIQGDDEDDNNDLPRDEKPILPFEPHENKNDNTEYVLRYVGGGRWVQQENNQFTHYVVYSGCPAYRLEMKRNSWLFRSINVQEKLH